MSETNRGTIFTDVNYCLLVPKDDSDEVDSNLLMQAGLTHDFKIHLQQALSELQEPFPTNLESFLASLVDKPSKYNPRTRGLDWDRRSVVSSALRKSGTLESLSRSSAVREYARRRIDPFELNVSLIQVLSETAQQGFLLTLLSNLSFDAGGVLIDSLRSFGPALNPDLMAILRPSALGSSPGLKVATLAFHKNADPEIPSFFIDDDPLIIEEVSNLGVCKGIYIPRTHEQLSKQPLLQQQALVRVLARPQHRVIIRGDGQSVADEINQMLNI